MKNAAPFPGNVIMLEISNMQRIIYAVKNGGGYFSSSLDAASANMIRPRQCVRVYVSPTNTCISERLNNLGDPHRFTAISGLLMRLGAAGERKRLHGIDVYTDVFERCLYVVSVYSWTCVRWQRYYLLLGELASSFAPKTCDVQNVLKIDWYSKNYSHYY